MKIYVAGPMSGIPEFNFPAFFDAQKYLEALGWTVFNPAEKDQEKNLNPDAVRTGDAKLAVETGFDFRECFTWDCNRVIEADGIYLLKGWEQSPGARAEFAVACAMKKHYPDYKIWYQ